MANNIKGITIKIGGDTTGLDSALKKVNGEIKQSQSQLREVEKLLKFDPSNTELLAQKQQLLGKEIDSTKEKIKTLTQAQEQMSDTDVGSEQYMALQREIIKAQQDLDRMNDSLAGTSQEGKNADKSIQGMNNSLEKTKTSSKSLEDVKEGLGNIAKVAGTAMVAVGATAIAVGKEVVEAYSEYEQLIGGVETLFKDSAEQVVKNANNAFQTAGMSASQYMETITSFSASLIQSLGGDTAKATDLADKAIKDMSDNANKMGTDVSMIQSAYAGFAKQNYTMLDNLKLGYGGTKTEMERLLADANEYNRQQGIHTNYQIENYSDIINAIHDMQVQMGIAGATELEASTTIEGSINSLKASFSNFVVSLSGNAGDIDALMNQVMNSFDIVINNIEPVIDNLVAEFPNVINRLIQTLVDKSPAMAEGATELFINITKGIIQSIPSIIDAIPKIVQAIWDTIFEVDWMQLGKDIIQAIIDGILSMVSGLASVVTNILSDLGISNGMEILGNSGTISTPAYQAQSQQQTQLGTKAQQVQIEFTGDLAQLGRVLQPTITYENTRQGVALVV